MLFGLQTHFQQPIGVDLCREVRARGFQMARCEARDPDVVAEILNEIQAAKLRPLFILADPEQIRLLPAGCDAELLNEPDGDIPPTQYRALLNTTASLALEHGVRLWAPALSNLDENSFKWANEVRDVGGGWPDGMHGVSIHRYGPGRDVTQPHAGFVSRANEVDRWLFALRQGKPFLVSEFGWPTLDLSEVEAADRIRWEWNFWSLSEAYAAVLYQLNDGVGEHERYGVRRIDGTWKEAILQTIPPEPIHFPPLPEPEPEPQPEPEPVPTFPVPDMGRDLTTWGKRKGATWASSLLARPVDYRAWAQLLGRVFHHRFHTQVNVTSARWPSLDPVAVWPYVKTPDGRFDLYAKNPEFWNDRLPRYIEAMNTEGGIVQLCLMDLYQFSDRKSGTPDKNLSPVRHNVNGIFWPGDDTFLATQLPDEWWKWFARELAAALRGAAVVYLPFNEGPEKDIHITIAQEIKSVDPSARVITNRNEDTSGQFFNMKVGKAPIDMIAFHGWKTLDFLKENHGGPDEWPATFAQFFDKKNDKGQTLKIDLSRIICSSDGSRNSSGAGGNDLVDPSKPWHEWRTYNWKRLLEVFQFVIDKGGNIEHQSVLKMDRTDDVKFDLSTAEVGFMEEMEKL